MSGHVVESRSQDSAAGRFLAGLAWAGALLRTGWLVLGLTIGLGVVLELGYRGQAALRRAVGARPSAEGRDPYQREPWFREYERERLATERMRWGSYIYWRRVPYRGRYITVDSSGRRRSVFPPPRNPETRHIWFFGGSTMWGSYQRDDATIPSRVAQRLHTRGFDDVVATNFGESGYVFTQEVIALLLELRRGTRPSVVVFYDGINDIASATQNNRPGIPQNESNRAAEFALGRVLAPWKTDFASEMRALGTVGLLAARRSQLLQRLGGLARRHEVETMLPEKLAAGVADTYARTAELVETIAAAYGFQIVYFWQPNPLTTQKSLTGYQGTLARRIADDPFYQRAQQVHRGTTPEMRSRMRTVAPGRFIDLSTLFDGDSGDVFIDVIGHTTESATAVIADSMVPAIARALDTGGVPSTNRNTPPVAPRGARSSEEERL